MALQRLNSLPITLISTTRRFFSTTTIKCKTFVQKYREFWSPQSGNHPPYGHFTQVGDPVLRSKSVDVPSDMIDSKEIDLIIDQMIKVQRKYDCVGIAAPQIGVSLRIIVMEFREDLKKKFTPEVYAARKMSTLPLTVSLIVCKSGLKSEIVGNGVLDYSFVGTWTILGCSYSLVFFIHV